MSREAISEIREAEKKAQKIRDDAAENKITLENKTIRYRNYNPTKYFISNAVVIR